MASRSDKPSLESRERLSQLSKGPWNERAKLAAEWLRPAANLRELAAGKDPVSRDEVKRLRRNADIGRETLIAVALRPHWRDEITDDNELALRDSLDWALTFLQLMELAIESGYLSDAHTEVRLLGRQRLLELLWSDGAVTFVQAYQYLPVRYLAKRLDIDLGLGELTLPTVVDGSDVRFAVFLDIYRDWVASPSVDEWLAYLDDYRPRGFHGTFREAWKDVTLPTDAAKAEWVATLAHGACRFVRFLGEIFGTASPEQRGLLGLFFAYWLARFFGYRVRDSGYTSRGVSWAGDATQFCSNPELIATKLLKLSQWHGDDPSEATTSESLLNTKSLREQYVGQLASDIITLETAWTGTLKRLKSER